MKRRSLNEYKRKGGDTFFSNFVCYFGGGYICII